MSRAAAAIALSVEERSVLGGWARGRSLPMRLVQRARIVMAAAGMQSQDIARLLRVSRPTVQLWRERFLSTHWSTRAMARAQGVSEATVRRIWKRHRLKPHLAEPFKLSKDERFYDKLQDVVGLYLNPPDKALVLCVDEKSRIQALERTRPLLPLRPGQPARQTHDYKRTGTPTLFAALNMPDGKAIGDCMSRHRHQEFIRFLERVDTRTSAELDLHLIVDNYARTSTSGSEPGWGGTRVSICTSRRRRRHGSTWSSAGSGI